MEQEQSEDPAIEERNRYKAYKNIVKRWEVLEQEVDFFEKYLDARQTLFQADLRNFKTMVKRECKPILNFSEDDVKDPQNFRRIQASNIPHFLAVWNTAKRSQELTGLKVKIQLSPALPSQRRRLRLKNPDFARGPRHPKHIVVDAVVNNGLEWLKVSLVDATKIGLQIAESGWDHLSPFDEGFEPSILKAGMSLVEDTAKISLRYRHPKVRFVLPNLRKGEHHMVDALLDALHEIGCSVTLGDELETVVPLMTTELAESMSFDIFKNFSPTLNFDCSSLISLVSDITYGTKLDFQRELPRRIRFQIEDEKKSGLLSELLWSAFKDRQLVCTELAAEKAQSKIKKFGSPTELVRLDILLGLSQSGGVLSREELVAKLQSLSNNTISTDLQLPIKTVAVDNDKLLEQLPSSAALVFKEISPVSRSVLGYGWANFLTTISSSRSSALYAENIATEQKEIGPSVWIHRPRNLVGREVNDEGEDSPEEQS